MENELMKLFLNGGVGTNGENFKVKFKRLVETVPKIHSPNKSWYYIYFFLGGALTVQYTKLKDEIGIRGLCAKIISPETIKLAFKIEEGQKTKLVFKTITTVKTLKDKQHLSLGEVRDALKILDLTQEELSNCEVEGEVVRIKDGKVDIKKIEKVGELDLEALNRAINESENLEALNRTINEGETLSKIRSKGAKFKKVENKVDEVDFEDALKKFSDHKEAKEGVENFLKHSARIYRSEKVLSTDSKESLEKKLQLLESEAAYHGFTHGVLAMNFKYKYALDIRSEPIAGKGYADLMVVSRYDGDENKKWDSPLCTFEGKCGKKETAEHAMEQMEKQDYDRAQPPMRTIIAQGGAAKGRVRAGFNYSLDPDHGGVLVKNAPEIIEPKSFKELFFENFPPEKEIKGKLNSLYYSIVQSNGGAPNSNYLSRLILGELLADNSLEKHVVVYDDNELWDSEDYTRPIQMNGVMSTFVLKAQDDKYIILNVIERENFKIDKNIPLPEGVDLSQCIQVDIRVNPEAKGGFEVEGDTEKSYYRDIKIIGRPESFPDEYRGKSEEIKHVDILDGEGKFQRQGFAEALFPLKELISSESDFQAVRQGLFTGQVFDEKAKGEDKIIRVFIESNHSGSGRADLILSILKKNDEGKYYEEKIILMEFKYAEFQEDAERKFTEGSTQVKNYAFNLKIVTDLREGEEYVEVFNSGAKSSGELLVEGEGKEMDIFHSSQESNNEPPRKKRKKGSCSGERGKRSIGTCIDSRDEESLEEQERKEELIKNLFDRDKIREIKENFEFYNQLFEVSKQVSGGEIIDPNIERDLIEKFKNIDLDSIDPEIKDIVGEIGEKISQEKVNKEEIKAILTRSGAAEKIGKIAEGAGHTLAIFFVTEHMIKGDIEGLDYDALNLLILPKIGEKVSGKLFELGTKYDSQVLRGFAPIAGSFVGNFLAFVGLGESIKALQGSTDLVDRKMAKLNIATNSLFIAADIPAVATGIMSSTGVSAGIVGEFAGPVGAFASIAVIITSRFMEAELKVEKVEESIKLTDEERSQLYWRFLFGVKMPEYIEHDMEAEKIYENYISKIIDKFKDDFDTMAISLPKIALEEKKYIDVKDTHIAIIEAGGPRKTCKIQSNITKFELDFPLRVVVDLRNISDARSYSRVIPEEIEGYRILCGPIDRDVQVELLSRQEYKDSSFELCSDYFKDSKEGNNGIMIQEQKKWSLDTYSTNCNKQLC